MTATAIFGGLHSARALLLAQVTGDHNSLHPAGPQASNIEWLYWVIFWICFVVFVLVVVGFARASASLMLVSLYIAMVPSKMQTST